MHLTRKRPSCTSPCSGRQEHVQNHGKQNETGFIICLLFMYDVELTGTGNDSQIICKERLALTDLLMVRPTLKYWAI